MSLYGDLQRAGVSMYAPGAPRAPAPRTRPRPQVPAGGDRLSQLAAIARAGPQEESAKGADGGGDGWGRGLGFVVNNPVTRNLLKPLQLLDVPRRGVITGLEEGALALPEWAEALVAGATLGLGAPMMLVDEERARENEASLKERLWSDPTYGWGTISKQIDTDNATLDQWLNRGVGLAGDIGLDPLTYATFGVGGALKKTGTAAAGRAARAGKVADAMAELRKGGQLTDDAAQELFTIMNRGYGAGSDEMLKRMDLQQGLRFELPFTKISTPVIPGTRKLGKAINRPFGAVRGAINRSDAGQRLLKSRTPKELERAMETLTRGKGTTRELIAASDAVRASRKLRRYSGKFAELGAKQVDSTMGRVRQEMAQYADINEYLRATENPNGPRTALNDLSDELIKIAKEHFDVELPEIQGLDYLPHLLSREFKALLDEGGAEAEQFRKATGLVTNDLMRESGFLEARKLRPGPNGEPKFVTVGGKTIKIEEGTIAEINEKVKELFPQLRGSALETDPQTLFERYVSGVALDVGNRKMRQDIGAEAMDNLDNIEQYGFFMGDEVVDALQQKVNRRPWVVDPKTGKRTRAADPFADDPFVVGSVNQDATTALNEQIAKQASQTIEETRPFADQLRSGVAGEAQTLYNTVREDLNQQFVGAGKRIRQLDQELIDLRANVQDVGKRKRAARVLARQTIQELNTEADDLLKQGKAMRRSIRRRSKTEALNYVRGLNARMHALMNEVDTLRASISDQSSPLFEAAQMVDQDLNALYAKFDLLRPERNRMAKTLEQMGYTDDELRSVGTALERGLPEEGAPTGMTEESIQASLGSSYQTAQGSTYRINPDGSSSRVKAAGAGDITAPAGQSETFPQVTFLSQDEARSVAAAQAQGKEWVKDGKLYGLVTDDSNLNNEEFLRLRREGKSWEEAFTAAGGKASMKQVSGTSTPTVGLHPLEYNPNGSKLHMGDQIVSVRGKQPAAAVTDAAPEAAAAADPQVVRVREVETEIEQLRQAIGDHERARYDQARNRASQRTSFRQRKGGFEYIPEYTVNRQTLEATPATTYDIDRVGRGKYEVRGPSGAKLKEKNGSPMVFASPQEARTGAEQDWLMRRSAQMKEEASRTVEPGGKVVWSTTPATPRKRAANAAARAKDLDDRVVATRSAARRAKNRLPKAQAELEELRAALPEQAAPAPRVTPPPTAADQAAKMERVPFATNRPDFEAALSRYGITMEEWDEMYPPPPRNARREAADRALQKIEAEAGQRKLRREPGTRLAYFASDHEQKRLDDLEAEIHKLTQTMATTEESVKNEPSIRKLWNKARNRPKGSVEAQVAFDEYRTALNKRMDAAYVPLQRALDQANAQRTKLWDDVFRSQTSNRYRRVEWEWPKEVIPVRARPWEGVSLQDFLTKRSRQLRQSSEMAAREEIGQVGSSLQDVQARLGAELRGEEGSVGQRIAATEAEQITEANRATADRAAQLRQGASEVPNDLARELDNLSQEGHQYQQTIKELTGDREQLIELRDQVSAARAAAPTENKPFDRLSRSEVVDPSGVVETKLRPKAQDLDMLDPQGTGLWRVQPLDSSLDDIETMAALNPNAADDVYAHVEAQLQDWRRRLDNATTLDIKARQADQVLREASKGEFMDVVEAKLRAEFSLMPEKNAIVRKEFRRYLENLEQLAKEPGAFGRVVGSYSSFFKTYATLSPGFHVRNVLSASFMNAVDGVEHRHQLIGVKEWKRYMDASKEGKGSEYLLQLTKDNPKLASAFDAVFGTGAGGRFFEAGFAESTALRRTRTKEAIYRNRLTRLSQRWGGNVEGAVRLGMALDSIAKGATVEQAIDRITRIHFDYSQVSRFDETAKQFIPFWTFMSRNLPMQVTEMWTRPKGYAIYNSVVRNVKSEPSPDTPAYLLEEGGFDTGFDTPFGFEIPGLGIGMAEGMDILAMPDLAHTRVQSDVDSLSNVTSLRDFGPALTALNPLITTPIELATGTNLFTGRQFDDTDVRKASGPLDKMILPLMWAAGGVQRGPNGQLIYDEQKVDALRSLIPVLDRSARLIPGGSGSSGDPDRGVESYARFFGVPVRTVSEKQKQGQRTSAMYEERDRQAAQRAMMRALAGG